MVSYTKWECLDEMDRKSKEIKQNILADYIKLTYTTSMFFLCQQNYWYNLLASTNISMKCQRNKKTELVDEMLCVYVYIQKEIIEMQKTCWSGWVCQAQITSASFPHALDLCYPQLAKIYHQTAMNINQVVSTLFMQENIAGGDSDQMVDLQIISLCLPTAPFSLPTSRLWIKHQPCLLAACCFLTLAHVL